MSLQYNSKIAYQWLLLKSFTKRNALSYKAAPSLFRNASLLLAQNLIPSSSSSSSSFCIQWRRSVSTDPYYYDVDAQKDPGHWRSDPQFQQTQKKWMNIKGSSKKLKLLFFNPADEPVTFVLHWFSVLFLIYCIFSLGVGETMPQRRRRTIQDRLYQEYGLSENDLDEVEGMEEPPLSDDDAEAYGAIMDPLLEPKEDTFTAWVFEPWFEQMQESFETDPRTSNYPSVVALRQLQQKRKGLPVEIRDFVKKSDADLLVDQLLERKDYSTPLSKHPDEFPGEDDGDIVRINRKQLKTSNR